MSDFVDLTISDSDGEARRPAKRHRRGSSSSLDAFETAPEAESDDVVLVERSEQEEQAQRQRERHVDLGDEELAVLGERGEVWNKNLPHTRDMCGEVPFSKSRSATNKIHCDKCYCYICDCPAGECEEWGEGGSYVDHCNAHDDSDFFRGMKRQRKAAKDRAAAQAAARAAARAARAGFGFGGGISPSAAELMIMECAFAAVTGRPRPGSADVKAAAKPGLPRPCTLRSIPDPVADRDLMLLARIEVGVKAQGSHTIAKLRKRLAPTGFYLPPDLQSDAGDRLHIGNLFETQWDLQTSKYSPTLLKLKKLALEEAPPEDIATRTRQVTILHYDGRARPTTYGVQVGKEATVQEIMDAAAPLAGLDAQGEQFVAVDLAGGLLHASFLAGSHKITDRASKTLKLGLWRLPKPTEPGPGTPSYAVVFHRKPSGQEHLQWTDYPQWEGAGFFTMVPLGRALANGGKTAERAVLERVMDALTPLRKDAEGAPPPAQAAKDLVGAGVHLCRTSSHGGSYSMSDPAAEFCISRQYNSSMRYGEVCFRDGRVFLRLDWTAERLAPFDTQAWTHAAVDDSASPAAMQPTLDIIKAHDDWAAKKTRAKQLPYSMLEELKSAARCAEPGVVYPLHRSAVDPLARVVVDLVPDSDGPKGKKGKAVFKVYVWKGDRGPPHRNFFRAHDSWDSGRSSRHQFAELGSNPLNSTMEVMLWGDAEHRAMKARVKEWSDKEQGCERSIPGLMKALERGEMPAAPQPPGLTVTMRPYQLQSLQFMLDRERGEGDFRRLFWERLQTPSGTWYWWSTVLGRASLEVPPQQWGGFCAEEMGLGKTIEVLGLILANPAPPFPPEGRHRDGSYRTAGGLIKSRATLVVCAVSLVGQWIAEAQAKLGGSLKMHMYHGNGRIRDPVRLATQFDLVVTTYATLSTDFGGKKGNAPPNFPPLGAIEWHRLVLDEAHTVKNAAVGHSKACVALKSERRWMCTGTPINTDVGDLYGQLCVLGLSPFNIKNFFDHNIKSAFGNNVFGGHCPALLYTLGQVMVRHTKKQVLGGEEVLRLPSKTEETVAVVLTEAEQEMYKKAHAASVALFAQYRALGNACINKHLLQIMALLLPMRRVCSGGTLKQRDLSVKDPLFGEYAGVRRRRLSGGAGAGGMVATDHSLVAPEEECAICIDMLENPSVTPCNHWFCRECILGVLAANAKCPLCRRDITAADLRHGITAAEADEEEAAAAAAAAAAGDKGKAPVGEGGGKEAGPEPAVPHAEPVYVSESKLQALLKELRSMRRADPSAKALIFSQYVTTIEWLKTRLTQAGFGYRFISGSMPLKQRAKAINAFQQDPPTTVFLLSMRSGSVGINLTAASHVFLMEPALNPALEEQAIGRAWRMGQQRTVTVKKFYVKGSVEERIMEVVKQRTDAVAGGGAGAGAGAGDDEDSEYENHLPTRIRSRQQRTNVRMQDLVGSINADRQQLRVSELEVLFQEPAFPAPRVPESDSEDEEEDARAAAGIAAVAAHRAGTSRAHAALGGSYPRRGAGRHLRRVGRAADSEEEEGEDWFEEEATGAAPGHGAREEPLGRGARRATRRARPINYAELSRGEDSEVEGAEDEEEEGGSDDGGEDEAAAPPPRQVQQRRGGGGIRGRKRKRLGGGDSSDEEWAAPQEEEEEEAAARAASSEDEDFSLEEEESLELEEWERPAARRRSAAAKARAYGRQAAARGTAAATADGTDGEEEAAGEGRQQEQREQQEQRGKHGGRQEQEQPAARIRSVQVGSQPAVAVPPLSSRPGSASGRLSSGEPAVAPASDAAAAATAAPAVADGSLPRLVVRGPKRGHRVAALMAHLTHPASAEPAAGDGAATDA